MDVNQTGLDFKNWSQQEGGNLVDMKPQEAQVQPNFPGKESSWKHESSKAPESFFVWSLWKDTCIF